MSLKNGYARPATALPGTDERLFFVHCFKWHADNNPQILIPYPVLHKQLTGKDLDINDVEAVDDWKAEIRKCGSKVFEIHDQLLYVERTGARMSVDEDDKIDVYGAKLRRRILSGARSTVKALQKVHVDKVSRTPDREQVIKEYKQLIEQAQINEARITAVLGVAPATP